MTFLANSVELGRLIYANEAYDLFQNPNENKYSCIDCNEELSIKKEHLRFNQNEKYSTVMAHFFHSPESKCQRCNETDSHRERKEYVANLLFSDKTFFSIGNVIFQMEKTEFVGQEITRNTGRKNRADLLLETKSFNPVIGNGISIEIPVYETDESLDNKILDWTMKGYSVSILRESFFREKQFVIPIEKTIMESTNYEMNLLLENTEKKYLALKKLHDEVQNSADEIKQKIIEETLNVKRTSCRTCKHSSIDKYHPNSGMLACWSNCKNRDRPRLVEPMFSCGKWMLVGDDNGR